MVTFSNVLVLSTETLGVYCISCVDVARQWLSVMQGNPQNQPLFFLNSPSAELIDERCSALILFCLRVLLKINLHLQTVKLKHLPAARATTH